MGIDGVTKARYGERLEENLRELVRRMKQMAYRPQPVRQVLIPKEGKPGATRPLGISVLEDRMVQKRMQEVLESLYEPLFPAGDRLLYQLTRRPRVKMIRDDRK